MSVFITSQVWAAELPNANAKLVLLALADIANHDGLCWPSMKTICRMCGLTENTARVHLAKLEELGILKIEPRTTESGRSTSNLFRILLSALPTPQNPEGPKIWGGEPPAFGRGTPQDLGGGPPGIWDPQNRHSEPSTGTTKGTDIEPELGLPDSKPIFPAAALVESWNRLCVSLTAITSIRGDRAKQAAARWKECKGDLLTWEEVCKRLEASDFATGRRGGTDGRTWKATFDWFVSPGNFDKVREGKYDNRPTETPKTHGTATTRKIGWGHTKP